jgi:LmbE family N-acetylglucosaminyl deacetylase
MKNKLLIVAAHPDDEILGCGGTTARLIREGFEAYTLILGEGITSRDEKRQKTKRRRELDSLKTQIYAANKALGVRDVFIYDFPDNRFDSVPLLDIIKVIEKIKSKVKPDIIFTHYENDLNIDHQITYRALLTAARPLPGETVKEIYSFEVLSSTEWNFPQRFSPDVFFDISQDMDRKIQAINKYSSELKCFPHPRSIEGIKINANYWGTRVGMKYAEAFKLVRMSR